jgi:hypothetical protein
MASRFPTLLLDLNLVGLWLLLLGLGWLGNTLLLLLALCLLCLGDFLGEATAEDSL